MNNTIIETQNLNFAYDQQPVIRMQRDTLYSAAVIDISEGADLVLPDAGDRYLSAHVMNADHYTNAIFSDDGGKTWHQRNEGIDVRTGSSQEDIPIFSVTIDPGNPDIMWCGTQNSRGIFKSEITSGNGSPEAYASFSS